MSSLLKIDYSEIKTSENTEHDFAPWLYGLLISCADEAGFNVLGGNCHDFEPQGATAFVMLSESHIAVHTWPEKNKISVTIATCSQDKSKVNAFKKLFTEAVKGVSIKSTSPFLEF